MTESEKPFHGQDCPKTGCKGQLLSYCSKRKGRSILVRYLKCSACGFLPEQQETLKDVPRRISRRTSFI